MEFEAFIRANEVPIRLGFFFGIFAVMAVWELAAPRRPLTQPKGVRWANNVGLVFFNSFLARLVFPTAAVGMALFAREHGWGLLNHFQVPYALAVVAAVIALDFFIYLQHVMVHAVPVLWRLHRVHHADLDYDVTTGARFHPLEILLSMLIKFAVIVVMGPPVLAVILFEIILNATSMFNHSNVQMPVRLDRVLRWFVVTPDMHRIHHSVDVRETNSNYGFNVPWWDRLFGTYCAEPALGQLGMKIGLEHLGPPVCLNLFMMLRFPFVATLGRYVGRQP